MGGSSLVDVPRHWGRTDEGDGVDIRVRAHGVYHVHAAVDQIHHPGRQAGFMEQFHEPYGGEGYFSEGLRTKVFPQTMAMGYIHMGTMAGKLKGVIPAQTPTGWRMVSQSIPLAICSSESPMSR